MAALNHAEEHHGDYMEVQRRMVADALGDSGDHAAEIAAQQLVEAVEALNRSA